MPIGEKLAQIIISIHAPRKGERRKGDKPRGRKKYFNPRAPQGGATTRPQGAGNEYPHFNPRSPLRGATIQRLRGLRGNNISIHAPRKGERRSPASFRHTAYGFQSTLPARGSDARREA